jgi:hypothetical protein
MAGGWLGSWGWGMWACQTGEREEVVGVVLLLRHLKPFGRLKNLLQLLNYFLA